MTWYAVGAASVAAAGSIAGGVLGSSAAGKASSAQTKAANQSNALAYQQYLQSQQYQMPYRYVGNQALNVLADTYGLDPYSGQTVAPQYNAMGNAMAGLSSKEQKAMSAIIKKLGYNPLTQGAQGGGTGSGGSYQVAYPGAHVKGSSGTLGAPQSVSVITDPQAPGARPGNYNAFFASPDYQFRLDQQQQALDRSNASKGMLLSGAQQKATARYSGDLASGEFGNWYNHLASLANIGQTATNNLQNAGSTYGQDAQRNATAAGDARASGYLGQANSWGNALAGVANAAGSYLANRKPASSGGYYNNGITGEQKW